MHIVVTELPVEDALSRARARFEKADRHLAHALAGAGAGLPWLALGVLAMAAGFLALAGAVALPAALAPLAGAPIALGGAFAGHGLPAWMAARRQRRRREREWHHALELLRLREQQAVAEPGLTVEVLERLDPRRPFDAGAWKTAVTAPAGRYVQ